MTTSETAPSEPKADAWSAGSRNISFWRCVAEDSIVNGGRAEWGARAMFAYRFGCWRRRIRLSALRYVCDLLYRLLYRRARNGSGIDIGDGARIGARLDVRQGGVTIHPLAVVGDDCVLRQGVFIGVDPRDETAAPVLADRVDVGAGAAIIGRVRIGSDVSIGPNAVVVADVPDGATVMAPGARAIMPPRAP